LRSQCRRVEFANIRIPRLILRKVSNASTTADPDSGTQLDSKPKTPLKRGSTRLSGLSKQGRFLDKVVYDAQYTPLLRSREQQSAAACLILCRENDLAKIVDCDLCVACTLVHVGNDVFADASSRLGYQRKASITPHVDSLRTILESGVKHDFTYIVNGNGLIIEAGSGELAASGHFVAGGSDYDPLPLAVEKY